MEQKFEEQLVSIEQKIDILERGQQEFSQKINHLDIQVAGIQKKESRLEKTFELLEDDFKDMGDEVKEVWLTVENLDKSL